ncbi:MAG: hypothetical protein R2932_22905 [Caldilineaceae bacterium]
MISHSNLIMTALYEDRKREVEQIMRARRAAGLYSTPRSAAARQIAHWVGTRLIRWGQQLQGRAVVTVQDAVVQ